MEASVWFLWSLLSGVYGEVELLYSLAYLQLSFVIVPGGLPGPPRAFPVFSLEHFSLILVIFNFKNHCDLSMCLAGYQVLPAFWVPCLPCLIIGHYLPHFLHSCPWTWQLVWNKVSFHHRLTFSQHTGFILFLLKWNITTYLREFKLTTSWASVWPVLLLFCLWQGLWLAWNLQWSLGWPWTRRDAFQGLKFHSCTRLTSMVS